MADIRINALTSTAATTASDDYFAVDGSSNGTRKLSAFSPTLGGNLTVTGTAAISGGLTLGSGSGAIAEYLNRGTTAQSNLVQWQTAGSANWSVGSGATGTGTDLEFYNHNTASSNLKLNYSTGAATLTGNLTVSGTGNSSVAGKLAINGGDLSASQFAIAAPSGSLAATLTAGATTNQSFGLRIFAGTSASDYALKIRNVGDTSTLLNVDGVGATTIGGNLTVSGTTGVTATDLTLGASGPSVKSTLSARAPRQGLVFDGTATGTVSACSFAPGNPTTVSLFVTPRTDSANGALISTRVSGGGGTAGVVISRLNNGKIASYSFSGTPADIQSTGTAPINKTTAVDLVYSGTSLAIYLNGVLDSTTSVSGLTTTASSIQIGADGVGGGVSPFVGTIVLRGIYNRALSASEVVALYEAGAPAGADYNSASNTAINTGSWYNANWPYTSYTGVSSTGFTAVMSTGNVGIAEIVPTPVTGATGQRIRVTVSATLTSGATPSLRLFDASYNTVSNVVSLTAGSNTVELVATAAFTKIGFYTSGATSYAVSGISVVRTGLLLAPDAAQAGGGLVWYDTSGNAANITLPASGVSWNVPSSGNWGGNLTVPGTLASVGNATIGTTSGGVTGKVTVGNGVAGNSALVLRGGSTQLAWQVGSNINNANALEFSPSTANGGTTFTSTVWRVDNSGNSTQSGNLTVSGTGASSFAGRLSISSTTGVGLQTALAVSSSSGLGVFTDYTKTSGTSRTWSLGATGSSSSAGDNAFALYDGTAAAFRFLVTSGGNFLIGTTTDGGQKLQVNGTARVSGVTTVGGGSNDLLKLEADTAGNGGYLMGRNAADTDYTPLILIGNGLTLKYRNGANSSANALAIDSSANATFAGNITRTRSAAGSTGSAVTDYLVRLGNSTSPSAAGVLASNIGASNFRTSLVLRTTDTSGNAVDAAIFDYAGDATFAGNVTVSAGKYLRTPDVRDGTSTNDRLVHTSSTTAVFAGGSTWTNAALYAGGAQRLGVSATACSLDVPLKLNNAYQAGAPTATGYVTIQDSAGNTYKVLVGT